MRTLLFVAIFALMITNIFATERFLSRESRHKNGIAKIQNHRAKCPKGEQACGNMCCGHGPVRCCSHPGIKGGTYLTCC